MLLSILLVLFGLTAFDNGPVGHALRRVLVEAPARSLARLTRDRFLGLAVITLAGLVAVLLFEAEGVRLFSLAAPELTAWVMMFDVTVVFDLVVLAIGLRAASAWRAVARQATVMTHRTLRLAHRTRRILAGRAKRIQRPRFPGSGLDDVEPDAVFA